MRSRSQRVALALAAVAMSLGWIVQAAEQPMIGQPAPAFDLPSLDGENVSLAGLRGKLVVLHFGTDW